MKDLFLIPIMLAVFVFGYFVIQSQIQVHISKYVIYMLFSMHILLMISLMVLVL